MPAMPDYATAVDAYADIEGSITELCQLQHEGVYLWPPILCALCEVGLQWAGRLLGGWHHRDCQTLGN